MRAHLIQLLALVAMASVSWSATILVRPDYSGDFPTIQEAVDAASSGDEIVLGDGRFTNSGNWGVEVVGKALTIRSESGDPRRCVIDCGTLNRAFEFDFIAGETRLEGITVTRGGSVDIGGAILSWYAPTVIRRCIFTGCTAQGATLFLQDSAYLLESCVVADNVATRYPGSGIASVGSAVTISRCTVARNGAEPSRRGAGVYVEDGATVVIDRSIVSGSTFGEGIWCDETSTAQVSCSDVFGNAGGDWVGCVAGQEGINGNFSADPLFCDPDAGVYTLLPESPCADVSGCGLIGALPVQCEVVPPPAITLLGTPHPNPSSGAVRVRFEVSPETVGIYELNVFDLMGRRVHGQFIVAPTAAAYDLSWDGTDGAGRVAGPGAYFLSVRGGGFEEARKVIRVR